MKIAQVAPLYESVPPRLYGGTERVVCFLTEELVKQGHEVTLFASGDSKTNAGLVAIVPEALRLKTDCEDMLAPHIVQLGQVFKRSHEFDVIHFHTDYLGFPFASHMNTPHLTTLHGRLTIPELQMIYNQFPEEPVVSISDSQRRPLPQANFVGRVHHGLPADLFRLTTGKENYLAFLGRISPEKRCDRAIEMAIQANIPIKIAAKIDKADRDYFEKQIRHLFDHPLVEYIGEINEVEKQDFLGKAKALLFPIDWPEPFGIVLIEALACGTPVIAWDNGSVPEIIEQGKSGFIVHSMEEAAQAIDQLNQLDYRTVRSCFDERFTARRMAEDYLHLYEEEILKKEQDRGANGEAIPINLLRGKYGVKAI